MIQYFKTLDKTIKEYFNILSDEAKKAIESAKNYKTKYAYLDCINSK